MRKGTDRKGSLRKVLGILVILTGLGIFLYPEIRREMLNYQTRRQIREFQAEYPAQELVEDCRGRVQEQSLNREEGDLILQEKSREIEDSESWDEILRELTYSGSYTWDLEVNPPPAGTCLGYIEIPVMSVTLPLYYGTDDSSLARGAGILEGSDLPYGGIGRNCVIAGHRGYRGAPYFREIEILKEGDPVLVTNEEGCMTYRVSEISIIDPWDREALKADPERDRITLMTCHPYRSHGKYRYLVFCDREVTGNEAAESCVEKADKGSEGNRDGVKKVPREEGMAREEIRVSLDQDIHGEDLFRLLCGGWILFLLGHGLRSLLG